MVIKDFYLELTHITFTLIYLPDQIIIPNFKILGKYLFSEGEELGDISKQ